MNAACQQYSAPYVIKLGSFELAVLDSSEASEDVLDDKQVAVYTAQLASLHVQNAWLVAHHPFWGFKDVPAGKPEAISVPLAAAWNAAAPQGINLVLAGHVHLFEVVSFGGTRPVQLVAGDGGTDLAAPIAVPLEGSVVRGTAVLSGETRHQFGYSILTKSDSGWQLTLQNRLQHVLLACSLSGGSATCHAPISTLNKAQ